MKVSVPFVISTFVLMFLYTFSIVALMLVLRKWEPEVWQSLKAPERRPFKLIFSASMKDQGKDIMARQGYQIKLFLFQLRFCWWFISGGRGITRGPVRFLHVIALALGFAGLIMCVIFSGKLAAMGL